MALQNLNIHFTKYNCPDWVCPSCGNKTLEIISDSFNSGISSESLEIYRQDYGELSDIKLVFSCLLECKHSKCKEIISVAGNGCVEEIPHDERTVDDDGTIEYFQAKFFIPPLKVFIIPASCPQSVSKPLDISFSLFLNSPSAAANTIRIALEALMDEFRIEKKGSLHKRIERLPEGYSEFKDSLMAIKWLGNAGSHEIDLVEVQDIMDAYEIIAFILNEIYESKISKIRKITKRMTNLFNPPKTSN